VAKADPTRPAPTAQPTVLPTPAPSPTPDRLAGVQADARAELERGYELLVGADYAAAIAHYEKLAGSPSGAGKAEAQLRLGQALARAEQAVRAKEVLETLRREQPSTRQAEEALGFLAEAEAGQGNIDAAVGHVDALAKARPELGPSLRLKLAEWAASARRHDLSAQAAEAGLKDAQPRLLRIELAEKLGEARTALGDHEGAYQAYREILSIAGTASYLGEQLYNLAAAYRQIGREEEALRALQTAVRDFPRAKTAPNAVQLLERMGQLDSVDGYRVGRIRYIWGNYRGAVQAFDQYLAQQPNGPDAEPARLYRALSIMAPGSEAPAIEQLRRLAAMAEDEEIVAHALVEAGKGYESAGNFGAAAGTYEALLRDSRLAGTEGAEEGPFRHGLALYMAGNNQAAVDAWRTYLTSDPEAAHKARALYWTGKALERLGRGEEARQAYQQSAAQRPLSYFGLRAHRKLHPDVPTKPLEQIGRWPTQQDEQELARWYRSRGLDLEQARATVTADPTMARAQRLAQAGLYREADWEFEELITRHREYGDRLYVAAAAFQRMGLSYGGTKLGEAALAASTGDESALDVPKALARVANPLPYAQLVWPWAERNGIDPLLFTALMHQESEFDASARSVADAKGLTQVIPPTGLEIAAKLGVKDFQQEDLYQPMVSVRFGTSYFGDRLRRFNGNTYLALAAYNAGDGNVDRMVRPERVADPDVFAEYIPFEETHGYVRKIFGYWELYRALYGG
jgi:soluble lytic murein transglycosylase